MVNTLEKENLSGDFFRMSPAGNIPVIEHEGMRMNTQGELLYQMIIMRVPRAQILDISSADCKREMPDYFFGHLRNFTAKLTTRIAVPKFRPESVLTLSEPA